MISSLTTIYPNQKGLMSPKPLRQTILILIHFIQINLKSAMSQYLATLVRIIPKLFQVNQAQEMPQKMRPLEVVVQ